MNAKRLTCLALFLCLFLSGIRAARAEESYEEYIKPGLESVIKTMIRFGALDMKEDAVVDSFARIAACDLYKKYFDDEFQWKKVRPVIRDFVRKEIATYPTGYRYESTLQLGRYNFKEKFFPFTDHSQRFKINVFPFYTKSPNTCGSEPLRGFTQKYSFILDKPIDIVGLPLDPDEAKALLKRLDVAGNMDRIIYVRFNMRVTFVAPLAVEEKEDPHKSLKVANTTQVAQNRDTSAMVLDARLDSAEYYEDDKFSKLIYIYRP
ncbi:MAG: DUF4852 domain-containing protein [Bdellovibrionales bacterium]